MDSDTHFIRRDRRLVLGLAAAALAAPFLAVPMSASPAFAGSEVYTGWLSSAALDGYDPVAYFRAGQPVKGSSKISYRWKDATWHFASEANRTAFIAEPEKYSPQYGGHCSWAAARGYKAKGDPNAWRIVDGKLYVNYNAEVHAEWEKDVPGNITNANTNWPRIRTE